MAVYDQNSEGKAGLILMPELSSKIWCMAACIRPPSNSILSFHSHRLMREAIKMPGTLYRLTQDILELLFMKINWNFPLLLRWNRQQLIGFHLTIPAQCSHFSQVPIGKFHFMPETNIFIHFLQYSSIFPLLTGCNSTNYLSVPISSV